LRYGELEHWKKVAEKYGTTKPYRGKNSRKGAGIKDRRPPDTTKDLLSDNSQMKIIFPTSNKKEIKQYQSYPHFHNSCYITSLLEILYNYYLTDQGWWSNNVGTMSNDNSGLKKIYASFIIREQLTNKSKKSSYNDAREVVRQYILEKKWEQDWEYGSLTLWYENIIKENDSLNILSYFCPLGIRIWKCESGHIRIAPTPMSPLILINGLEDFDTPFFDENKHLIGRISALFAQKDGFISSEHPNESCQHSRVNIHKCDKRKIIHEEFIVSWPKILIFEITERDNGSFNSSESLNFPLHLNSGCLNYSLLGRAYSTSKSGSHFYCRLIKKFNENSGVYKYDDLNGGIAILESNNPISLAGEQQLTTLIAYNLEENNSDYFNSKTS
jgi:hypothetical protein